MIEATANETVAAPTTDPALERIETAWWADLLAGADSAEVRPPYRVGGAVAGVFPGCDVLALNRVVGLGVDEPVTDGHLATLKHLYRKAGVGRFFVPLAPCAETPGLAATLERCGFRRHNRWAKLVRDAGEAPRVDTDLRIDRVRPEHGETCARLFAPAVDWPPAAERLLAQLVGRPGWRHYLAFDGERPVATAALFLHGDDAGLTFAATHPEHRGRGAQSALLAHRIREATGAGARQLVVETAEDRPDHPSTSHRNVRRAGFRLAYLRPNWLWER